MMILKSFILGNLVSLYMKIINSAVVVGLYYGFLTTFSMGPSYLLLLRTWFLEEGDEEGTEKRVSATTGFLMGQLMVFISTYYAPLHLALGRSHTITLLALAYFVFHFYWNSNEDYFYFDYGPTTRNSMRNLIIQCVFLNNFISPLLNHFLLPSSMAVRLANIYMFRCNNKILFVTSSFVAWLIGYILFIKWVGFILVWIQQNNPLRLRRNMFIRSRSNKYLWAELRNYMDRIFTILLFFIFLQYSAGRKPLPYFSNNQRDTLTLEEEAREAERRQEEEEEEDEYDEEDPSYSVFDEEDKIDEEEILVNGKKKIKDEFNFHVKETCYKKRPVYETFDLDGNQENWKFEIKETDLFGLEEPLATTLFDFQRRNRPFQAVKTDRLTVKLRDPIQNRMSEFFFHTCRSDGKERISFTYPSTLSTFLEMIQRKISLLTTEKLEKLTSTELYNHWKSNNEQRKKTLSNEFLNRVKNLDKGSPILNILEKRTRLYNHKTQNKYLPKILDPLLSGPSRGKVQFRFSPLTRNQKALPIKNSTGMLWTNKIYLILLTTNYQEFDYQEFDQEFEPKIDTFNRKSFSIKISYFFNLVNEFAFNLINEFEFAGKSLSNLIFKGLSLFPDHKEEKINLEDRIQILDSLFPKVILDFQKKKIKNKNTIIREERKEIEIRNPPAYPWLRKSKRIEVFVNNDDEKTIYTAGILRERESISILEYPDSLLYYSSRRVPANSTLGKRRKSSLYPLYQVHLHSLLFLERTEDLLSFLFSIFYYISERIKMAFLTPVLTPKVGFKILGLTYTEKNTTEKKTKERERKEKKEEAINQRKKEEEIQKQNEEGQRLAEDFAEDERLRTIEEWESDWVNQISRTFILLFQSNFRKYILVPSLIIAKSIIRILLFQTPEWSKDLQYWKREIHFLCTYDGTPVSETKLPKEWLDEGLQIKILFPFRLKPWHRSKPKPKFLQKHKDQIKKKNQNQSKRKDLLDSCFLTVVGLETHVPFGPPRSGTPFLEKGFTEKILKQLKKKIRKWTKNSSLAITILIERRNVFLNCSEERRKNWFIQSILFLNKIKTKFSKPRRNPKSEIGFIEGYGLNETKTEKDLIIKNLAIDKISTPIQPMDLVNHSVTKAERTLKNLSNRTKTIRNEIEKLKKEEENQKGFINSERNISPNKLHYNIQKLKSILHILKKKTVRLMRKSDSFFKIWIEKIWIERIYIDRLLNITKIVRIRIQVFLELTRKIISTSKIIQKIINKYIFIKKYIYNNKENKKKNNKENKKKNNKENKKKNNKKIDKTNKNTIHFISFLEKIKTSNRNLKIFYDVTSLSQAYVFYKLAKIQTSNFYKNEITDFLEGLFPSKLKDINFRDSVMNQWKNWLRSHYPYKSNFFKIKWSELILQKWRNRVNQQRTVKNKDLNKSNSEKLDLLPKVKDNYKKHNRYNLLSHKSINSRGDKEKIGFNYKTDKMKREFFHILRGTPSLGIPNSNFNNDLESRDFGDYLESEGIFDYIELEDFRDYLESEEIPDYIESEDVPDFLEAGNLAYYLGSEKHDFADYLESEALFDMEKSPKRKYFDWRIFHFCLRNKEEMEFWINIGKNKKNTETESKSNKYQIIEKESDQDLFCDKDLCFPTLLKRGQEVVVRHPPELDWMGMNDEIVNCLVSNFELGFFFPKFEKLYNAYKRRPWVIPIQLLLFNYNENPSKELVDLGSILRIKRKKLFAKPHCGDNEQFRPMEVEELEERISWNIQTYNYLMKSNTMFQKKKTNKKGWIKSFIRRTELTMDIFPVNGQTSPAMGSIKLIKRGRLTIETPRIPRIKKSKINGKFLMYQTIAILLVHKSKQQINQGCGEKSYINKENFIKSIERLKSLIGFRKKNDFLVPENLLSTRSRRELRILISFNSENDIHMNTELFKSNNIKNCSRFHIIEKSKYFDREKKKLLQFKLFLWPNFRFEDLACMNRFWFNTNNASRFSMLRIRIYPQLQIK
uniref:Protein TIC 214 n=1 Tax=Passiflora tetrandra TaxID=237885 RepID=A0A4Y5QFB0_9ROSI|nr:Ycf1 [Passiflora tetrandra]YP_009671110.1 Ycf1 [Passiflora tetrandra]QCX30320.1 Ycf1 [Passiflora tetrandra]QCX30321.1 Ycf1 [Passiflora tetrandra]